MHSISSSKQSTNFDLQTTCVTAFSVIALAILVGTVYNYYKKPEPVPEITAITLISNALQVKTDLSNFATAYFNNPTSIDPNKINNIIKRIEKINKKLNETVQNLEEGSLLKSKSSTIIELNSRLLEPLRQLNTPVRETTPSVGNQHPALDPFTNLSRILAQDFRSEAAQS